MVVVSRKGRTYASVFIAVGLFFAAASAQAHHSFTMFDMTKRITLAGKVTAFQWTNPHAYIEVDVQAEDGSPKHWSIELGSPSILQRSGWKFSTLKPGDTVTLTINPLKSGESGGFLFQATLSNGRVLGNGPAQGGKQ